MFLLHARIPLEAVHLRRSSELVRGIGRPAIRGRSHEKETIHAERSGQIRRNRIRVEIRSESDRPNYETHRYVIYESLVQHTFYVLRPEQVHVLRMVTDLLWANQTLLRGWVVTEVGFGLVQTHAARRGRARWDLPLRSGEIYSGALV